MDKQKKGADFRLEHWHVVTACLLLYDALAICASYFGALWLRFDCRFSAIPVEYLSPYLRSIPVYVLCSWGIFGAFRLYNSIWRFASYTELLRMIAATAVCCLVHVAGVTLLVCRMPISYHVVGIIVQFCLTLGVRFSYRFILLERNRIRNIRPSEGANILIIGAGEAGQIIMRDIKNSPRSPGVVRCIIDDNPNKWNRHIDGVPVVGGREDILRAVEKYQIRKIYLAIPSASATDKRDILNICKETDCELKNLPGVYQLYTGRILVEDMVDVSVEDLLGRDPIRVDLGEIFKYLSGKTVLITGAAGSIGSELARQIAAHRPGLLVLLDIYENSTYELWLDLQAECPGLNFVTVIGSVRDSRKLDEVFGKYKPDVVFHAAAHKHVPLMEDSPCEAIKNNTIGTYKTAYAAMSHGCKRFVLISTDKAVNPTNIMGASKRLCEMVIQSFDRMIKTGRAGQIPDLFTHGGEDADLEGAKLPEDVATEFVAVRFGNVLGSNGSVIPIFKKQIARGGPVTVTHPDIIRYFMTIPEAVSLVLQATVYAGGGEIFVLDMGSPVKIDTLARNLIRLSGLRPDTDIRIAYSGLRPGEKLYEEKLMAEEGIRRTANELIYIGSPIPYNEELFLARLRELMEAAYRNDPDIRDAVAKIVPTYQIQQDAIVQNVK